LCFRKVTPEIFSELDKTKSEVPIFPDMRWSPKQRQRGGQEVATPPHGAGHPPGHAGHGVGPWSTPDITLPPIYSPRQENPKGPNFFPENIL
jgi:hypothetical protein